MIQIEEDKILCQFSNSPINKLCILQSCKHMNPSICQLCKNEGCNRVHCHDGFKKYIPLQEMRKRLTQILECNNIPQHLKQVNQQLEKLIGDLEILIAQHCEILSNHEFQYKLKSKATFIRQAISNNKWKTLSGSDLNYILKGQVFENKLQIDQKIYFEKNRIYKVFDSLRKSIGDYYYQKQKKSIKESLKSAAKRRDQQQFQQAILQYTKVLELYPNNQQALCYRGLCYSLKKNYEKALEDYTLCLKVDPRHAQIMSNIGHIFSLKKQKKIALQWYNKSVQTDSSNHLTLFNRGLIRMSLGRLQQAKQDFTRALKIKQCKQYFLKKAKCHQMLLQNDQAEECITLAQYCHS